MEKRERWRREREEEREKGRERERVKDMKENFQTMKKGIKQRIN